MRELLSDAWAVTLRDLKKSTTLWKQLLFALATLIILILISKGLGRIINLGGGRSYDSFFIIGMLTFMIGVAAMSIGTDLVADRKGFMKLLLVAPISRVSIALGKLIFVLIYSVRNYFLMFLLFLLYLSHITALKVLFLFFIIILITTLFVGIGFTVSAFVTKPKTADTVFQYVSIIFLFASGILYPIDVFPAAVRWVFYLNPMTYSAEAIRYIINSESALPAGVVFLALIILTCFFLVFGVYYYDKKQRG